MRRRHRHINIPTEIVRAVVVIAETGSFSKAAEKLGLSQPAISAQVKRLQVLVGAPVFEKVAGGVGFTERGKLVLAHARKLMDANDQIVALSGAMHDAQPLRLGLSALYVEQFLSIWETHGLDIPLHFYCDNSAKLADGLLGGFLDIACVINSPDGLGDLSVNWLEDFAWVRNPKFLLSPGAPIPLVSWPGSLADLPITNALEKAGLTYRVVFASAAHHARIAAVSAGIGLMGLPLRQVREPLIIAADYYLPPLEPLRAGVSVRPGVDSKAAKSVVELLGLLAPNSQQS